jgi:hypothetical protein
MLITNYQLTEIIIGTIIFPLLYFIYLYFTETKTIIYWDIFYCTIVLLITLLFKYFYINFNILQTQNFSSNNIVNGIY